MTTLDKLRAFAQSMIDDSAHQTDEVGTAGAHEAITVAGVCERLIAMIDERPVEPPITAPHNIPPLIRRSLDDYAAHGLQPGAGLFALLAGDVFTAIASAGYELVAALPAIVAYVYATLPASSYGTRDLVRTWIARPRS